MPNPNDAAVIERIWKLLRLATNNPNEEEARTAAMQAAKLIVEHKVTIHGRTQASEYWTEPYKAPGFDAATEQAYRAAAQYQAAQAEAQRSQYQDQMNAYWERERYRHTQQNAEDGLRPDGGSWWSKMWR